ncbi:endonuclease domain-containing protein [Nitrospina watsonii]|uniref:Endonuclease n=1 Tax=Nitrospina watsonii TaxID=1323948 RepID=A0ABM9HB09_9BACT|nr:endonuclease domain-containing protein [Nitrospina watsonii]CAI2717305.1 Endonuclease [Nitrospina watsonii]
MPRRNLRSHLPYDKTLIERARDLRSQSTPAENRFWHHLRQMPCYQETQFNRQKPIGTFIVDFYCHAYGLVIEIDGDTHGPDDAKRKDTARTAWLESQGLRVLRFQNREVIQNIEGVMSVLEKVIEEIKEEAP